MSLLNLKTSQRRLVNLRFYDPPLLFSNEAMVAQRRLIRLRSFLTDLPDKKEKMGINSLVEQGISDAQSLEIRYGLLTCWPGFGKVTQTAFVK